MTRWGKYQLRWMAAAFVFAAWAGIAYGAMWLLT